jgi:outer membrane immunogenic protein
MRKLVLTAATAALGLGLAAPAFAQDSEKAPFTGVRVEALGGYDNLSSGDDNSTGKDGFVYGGALGYDAQVGGVVLGVEGEITGSTTKVRATDVLTAGDRLRVGAGRDLYVGGRIGYAVSDRALIYAKGGYTNARVNIDYAVGTARIEDHTNLDGYRVGAGVEYNVTPRAYVKAEYRYSHYGQADDYDIDANRNQVLAGVGYRF